MHCPTLRRASPSTRRFGMHLFVWSLNRVLLWLVFRHNLPAMSKPEADQSSKPKYMDPTSPYFLPNGGLSGNSLTQEKLNGNNYMIWAQSATMNLRSYNKLGFVDGSVKQLDKNSPDYTPWAMVNSMVWSWIWNSLNIPIRATISCIKDPKTMWYNLKTCYSVENGPRIYKLWSDLCQSKQGGIRWCPTIHSFWVCGKSCTLYLRSMWADLTRSVGSRTCRLPIFYGSRWLFQASSYPSYQHQTIT